MEVMVVVVRRWVMRDCVPSRAIDWRAELRFEWERERSVEVGGRGLGSVAVRYEGVKVYCVGLETRWEGSGALLVVEVGTVIVSVEFMATLAMAGARESFQESTVDVRRCRVEVDEFLETF